MPLGQVKTARSHEQNGRARTELVRLSIVGRFEADGSTDRVHQIQLPLDQIVPSRSRRVLEVRHVDVRPEVHRIDHHLSVDWTRDLDTAIGQVFWQWSDGPVPVAYVSRLRQKV